MIEEDLQSCIGNIIKSHKIADDADEQDVDSCVLAVVANPKDFEACLKECFGKNKKLPDLILNFNQNTSFQRFLGVSNQKLIHKLPTSELKLGENNNFLYYFEFKCKDWKFTSIAQQIQDSECQLLKQAIQESDIPEKFFTFIDNYLLDFLNRRLDLAELVSLINQEGSLNKNLNAQFRQMIKTLTPTDLVAIVSKLVSHKADFGSLMHHIGFPIPLIFKTPSSDGPIQYFEPILLENILRSKDYNIVTSFGSCAVSGKGKTTYMRELYCLKDKYLNTQASQFHSGAVDFYTSVPILHSGRSLIVADFQGDCMTQSDQVNITLNKLITDSYVIYYHLTQKQFNSKVFMKQFEAKIFPKLKKSRGKTFLLIRDSDSQEQMRQYNGMQAITIPNISKKISPQLLIRNKGIIQQIEKMNLISPKLELSLFLSQSSSVQFANNSFKIKRIIDILKSHANRLTFYETMFPLLHNMYQISLLQKQIFNLEVTNDTKIEDTRLFAMILAKKDEIQILRNKQFKASPLVDLVRKELSENFQLNETLTDALTLWRNSATQSMQSDIIFKKATLQSMDSKETKNHEQLSIQIIQLQQKIQTYDVSIDTIFSEIIALEKVNIKDRLASNEAIIDQYYKTLYKNVTPINLIQGKTLQFGNKYLQSMFQALNAKQYKDKEIFVISVIGAQSSAKSTLMNYLFKCNFATSAGRCTKGVYFTIVQCNQKVIVVIDTEGLLSVSARDNIFDVQIASFVMLISDLVIINNKGQINTVLRNLMGVCIYAIDQLNTNKSKQPYKPNQIIFTIRDQSDDGSNKQKQMLASIITHLKENSKVSHQLYMKFTDSDIFPLQSAFMTQNIGLVCIQQANNCFGKAILALRSKIVDLLQTPKNKNIFDFYKSSEDKWKAIVNCGKNIFNFKCMLEIQVKGHMQETLDKLKVDHKVYISNEQKRIITSNSKNFQESENEIQQQLKALFEAGKQQLKFKFKNSFPNTKQVQWIQSFYPDIDVFNKRLHSICVDRVRQDVAKAKQVAQKDDFKEKINQQLKQLYTKNKTLQEILEDTKNKALQLLKPTLKDIQNTNYDLKHLQNNKKSIQIRRLCEEQLSNYFKQKNDTGFKLGSLSQEYYHIQSLVIYSKGEKERKHLVQYFGNFNKMGFSSYSQVYDAIKKYFQDSNKSINKIISKDQFTILERVKPLIVNVINYLNIIYEQFSQDINQITIWKISSAFVMRSRQHIIGRFIASLPKKIQLQMIKNCLNMCQMQKSLRQSIVDERLKQVVLSFEAKGNNEKTADNWINKIIQSILQRHYNKSLTTIKNCLDNVNSNLSPEKLIQKAMNHSIDSPDRYSKDRMIKCFKVIANINKYIKQLVYQEVQIKDLTQKIDIERINMMNFTKQDMITVKEKIQQAKNSHSQDRNVQYYAKLFQIDLQLYNSIDFENNLANILLVMARKIENQFNHYQTISGKLITKRRQILEKQSRDYLSNKIEPSIIGCQARCPSCRMKCKKSAAHTGGHEVIRNTHVLICFAGFSYENTNVRCKELCYNQEIISRSVRSGTQYIPFMDWIKNNYVEWYDHFNSGVYAGNQRRSECQFIWKNIGDMLIKHALKSTKIVNDSNDGQHSLTEKDIIAYKLADYIE